MHPIVIDLGRFSIHSYGTIIAVGGVLVSWFLVSHWREMGLKSPDDGWLVVNAVLAGGFLGFKILHLLENETFGTPEFWAAAFSLRAGFSVFGGFVGVGVGIWVLCRWIGASWLRVMDYVCLAAPTWHIFGRLGCFMAGCCYGRPAPDLPWAVTFRDPRCLVPFPLRGVPLHPAQLYDGFADIIMAGLLYWFILRRIEAGKLPRGSLCAAEFCGYAVIRFAIEPFRADVIPWAGGLTEGQGLALLLFAAGAALWLKLNARRRRTA